MKLEYSKLFKEIILMFSYILVISTAYILLISSFLMSEVEVGKITIIATILVIIFLHFLII